MLIHPSRSSQQYDAVKIAVRYTWCALETSNREPSMPQFLIERNFAEQLEVSKKKTYCLYEAPSAEAIREAARRLNIPADTIIELGGQLRPEMFE
jgi:hypothetical protein